MHAVQPGAQSGYDPKSVSCTYGTLLQTLGPSLNLDLFKACSEFKAGARHAGDLGQVDHSSPCNWESLGFRDHALKLPLLLIASLLGGYE